MKTFEKLKSEFLNSALKPIHYKKLRLRIYEELSNHMDDMYDDFTNGGLSKDEACEKVFKEMGNPKALGEELKKANSRKLFFTKLFKIIFAISALPLLICIISLSMFVIDDVTTYFYSYDIEEVEQIMAEEYNNGQPIKHLIDIEKDGTLHKYYIPLERKESGYDLFHTESIDFLGIEINDKFNGHGASNGNLSDDNIIKLCAGPYNYSDNYYYIFIGPTDAKYIKLYYEPIDYDGKLEPYWSDFIEYPQNGTYEEPVTIYVECPDGYCWSTFERFDENKEPID